MRSIGEIARKSVRFLRDEDYRWRILASRGQFNDMTDEEYLKLKWLHTMGYELDLEHPRTFNEKLQWLKLHDRRPEYTMMVDKYRVRDFVREKLGEEYLIPLLGVWDDPEEIDFDALPEQFVLKCNHDSGGLSICTNKATFDINKAKMKLRKSMARDYYLTGREWPYKNVPRKIVAEKYMVDESGTELKDYKYFCFDGLARAMFIASDRQAVGEDTKFDFYDMDFRHLPFTNGHPNAKHTVKRPVAFEDMRVAAEKLSAGIPQVRVDFYDINGKVYFGEMTFSHWSGMVPFDPPEWDEKFGEWIVLPTDTKNLGGGTKGALLASKGWIIWIHPEFPEQIANSSQNKGASGAVTSAGKKAKGLTDYKFYCFNGEPRILYVSSGLDNHATAHISFVTLDWQQVPFGRADYAPYDPLPPRPRNFNRMLEIAGKLSAGIPFLRVDLYEIDGQVYFSELTFSPCGGMMPFKPKEWDARLGDWLELPTGGGTELL